MDTIEFLYSIIGTPLGYILWGIYEVICKMRRDILQHRDSLGLTPKALQRLRRGMAQAPNDEAVTGTASPAFSALMDRIREAAHE